MSSTRDQIQKQIKKLLSLIKQDALKLNNLLPDEVSHFWITSEEFHERLLHAGVSRLLELSHIEDALQHSNKEGEKYVKT